MNSRKVQIVLALSLCLSLSLPARDASAMISINPWELFLLGLPYALEPLSPDIYVEWSDERSEAVLAWPLVLAIVLDQDDSGSGSWVVTPFVEYQHTLQSEAHRGLAGSQLVWMALRTPMHWDNHPMVFGVGPRIEGATLFGTDGHGAIGGAGLTMATFNAPIRGSYVSLSLMYRYTRAGSEERHAATIDFHSTLLSDIVFGRLF